MVEPQTSVVTDEHHDHRVEPKGWRARPLTLFGSVEDLTHYAIALLLAAVAVYVLAHTVQQLFAGNVTYAVRTSEVINGVLLVIIVTEILRTVLAHFEEEGFQLKPFLIIGIISAVRHILTIGAQLSLGEETGVSFLHSQVELGVSAGVALLLVLCLLLVRVSDRGQDTPD